jgi:hypothetical protein
MRDLSNKIPASLNFFKELVKTGSAFVQFFFSSVYVSLDNAMAFTFSFTYNITPIKFQLVSISSQNW